MIDHMLVLARIICERGSSQAAVVVESKSMLKLILGTLHHNMIRVAAHKLGSISSFPQSDTVLTILTRPADLQGLLHSVQTVSLTFQLTLIYMALNTLHTLNTTTHHPNVQNRSTPLKPSTALEELKL